MTKPIIIFLILLITSTLTAQVPEGQIISLDESNFATINIGSKQGVQSKMVFEVKGAAEVIHPATGQVVKRDNVLLGKIEAVEVDTDKTKCRILSKDYTIKIGTLAYFITSEPVPDTKKTEESAHVQRVGENNSSNNVYNTNLLETAKQVKSKKKEKAKPYFKVKKCEWPENDSIVFKHSKHKRVKGNGLILIKAKEQKGYAGYVTIEEQGDSISEGQLYVFDRYKNSFQSILKEKSFINYSPFLLQAGGGATIYLYGPEIPCARLNISWYPNKRLTKVNKYNDWIWVGASLNFEILPSDILDGDHPILSKIPDKYSDGSKLSTTLELGISPWLDNVTGSRKLNFGFSYKLLKYVASYMESGNTIYALKKHYPSVFLAYNHKLVSVKYHFGIYEQIHYDYSSYEGSESLYSSVYTSPYMGLYVMFNLRSIGNVINKNL